MEKCYMATLHAARATIADITIFEAYMTARQQETSEVDESDTAPMVGLLSSAATGVQLTNASWSFSACWAYATTGAWPQVIALTNPAGVVVRVVGLAIMAAVKYSNAQKARRILKHQQCETHDIGLSSKMTDRSWQCWC
jgi:hypothetical protein